MSRQQDNDHHEERWRECNQTEMCVSGQRVTLSAHSVRSPANRKGQELVRELPTGAARTAVRVPCSCQVRAAFESAGASWRAYRPRAAAPPTGHRYRASTRRFAHRRGRPLGLPPRGGGSTHRHGCARKRSSMPEPRARISRALFHRLTASASAVQPRGGATARPEAGDPIRVAHAPAQVSGAPRFERPLVSLARPDTPGVARSR